jgi:hypothetical protein
MDATTETTPNVVEGAERRFSRRRRVLAGIALVLACLTILIATVAVWAHQVALNTGRFTTLVSDALDEPAVIDPLSAAISRQVIDGLDVQARIENRLPDEVDRLAGPLTLALQDGLDTRLQVLLAEPRMQQALARTVSFAHERVVNLLRDRSNAISVVDGYVVMDVFPLLDAALRELQTIGIIPPEVQLPDLSTPREPGVLAQALEARLDVILPDDFGTIQLMPADRLVAAQTVVRAFDIVVIALILLGLALAALAVWLSANRRRMVVYLAVGTVIAFLLARLATNALTDTVIAGIANEGLAGATRSVVDAMVSDLRGWTAIILVVTVVLGIAAYLWGRPAWVSSVAERTRAPMSARDRRSMIERGGIAAIVFVVVWIALGPEVALIGAALLVGLELVLNALGSDDEPATGDEAVPTTGT